ncbi:autotransporter outer membrane beta-barrel domain-containing protein [Phascolarctobacterium faecium]|uniref:autotransporter outer membrane beta-barrel domain-containing protein n=1 Tax=Phascolarctobacterium faecium TaxID=33025 RepID=UPI003520D95D
MNNATLGFSGTAANRTVTGGKLQLTGSNAFRFTTDLANNKADSMTFDAIENNSSKQYIQIGYEEAFKDALSEADIVTVNGSATVLTITNLNGQNLNNFVGQASSLDSPLERFRVTPKVEASGNEVKITEVALAKEDTPSETAMTLSDAQMALGSMWRIEGNNLMKRMGDLRSDKEAAQGGVWARYYRGELSADSAYDRNFSQDYTAFQGGIDKVQDYKGGKLYTGIAINRIDSNAGYTAGSGDLSSTGVGLYASWLGGKGHYLDVIARGSKLTNDFKLVDLSGNAAKADYDTWAYGISAEYGYRQNLNAGWFVEPQAELSLGHLGSADYTTSNGVSVKQDSVNSAVVRLGFLGGKEFTIGGHPSNAYVKASALHDFGGNGGATGYYENSSLALKTGDLTGTWYEIGLGANLGIAKNSNLYFDALKTFGGNLRTDWQFNAGLRFTF